ncbi:hypothetical protein LTS10_010070 [Elasticomyces elasticus]|nr:hypothetical protein LTS10_010070 [Elasticomyces elasticus]
MAHAEAATMVEEPFPLFKLPPEIWARVGIYALGQKRKVSYQYSRDSNKVWQKRTRQPAITRTCQDLRAELLPIFYKQYVSCVFSFEMYSDWKGRAAWLHAIGAVNRHSLSDVRLISTSHDLLTASTELEKILPKFAAHIEPRKPDERERKLAVRPTKDEMVYSVTFT